MYLNLELASSLKEVLSHCYDFYLHEHLATKYCLVATMRQTSK